MSRDGVARRVVQLIGDLLTAKEIYFAMPMALGLIAAGAALVWGWFQAQPLLVQFTSASSAFLFLTAGGTVALRRVAQRRQLKVAVSARLVEVTVHMRKYTAAIIWLHDLVITNQGREPVSLELEGVWEFPDGRRWSRKGRWEKDNLVLNEQTPTFRDEDVRFLFPYYDAQDMGLTEDALRSARTTVILRDLVSRRERRFEVKHGQAIPRPTR